MRLIYLYIQDAGLMKDREYNFSSKYRFSICRDGEHPAHFMCKHPASEELDDAFFSLAGEKNHMEVSAIVGANGSGKTSIATFLHQILSGDTGLGNFAVAFQVDDATIQFYYRLEFRDGGRDWFDGPARIILNSNHFQIDTICLDFKPEVRCDDPNVKIATCQMFDFDAGSQVTAQCEELRKRIRMVYYSPVYSSQHSEYFFQTDYFRDLSTTAALRYATPEIVSGQNSTYTDDVSLSVVEANDTVKALTAAALIHDHEDELKDIGLPVPAGVRIQCNPRVIRAIRTLLESHVRDIETWSRSIRNDVFNKVRLKNSAIKQVEIIDIVKMTLETNKDGAYQFGDFVVCSFFLFAFSQLLSQKDENLSIIKKKLLELVVELFYEIQSSGEQNGDGDVWRSWVVEKLKVLSGQYPDDESLVATCSVFADLSALSADGQGLNCALNGNLSPELCSIITNHAKSRASIPYLTFSLSPHLSSGEMSVLTLLGRLKYDYDVAIKNAKASRNELVFLDEIETTMHPDLQRKLVWLLIWFYEKILVDVRPHLIFATHSPILLSDIPISNVVFLGKKGGKRMVEEGDVFPNTFAANIFDLYKDSFFLDNGTMGTFATGKVNMLLEKLNPKRKDNETDEEYNKRTKIGEDDLKIARLIGDPFLSRYVWRRLEELSKPVQDPENELIYLRNDDEKSSEAES